MSHVDFKKWPWRPVKFKGQGPLSSNLLTIDLRLDVRIACYGLQQKFQLAKYLTW